MIQKLDTTLSTVTTTWNKTITITGDTNIVYNKPSTVLENYEEVIDTYNLKQTERILITDVPSCPTVIDRDAPNSIHKISTKSIQTRFKYIRNMKNFNAI